MYNNCVFIPTSLWEKVLPVFHDGHPGICAMKKLTRVLIWYPGIDKDTTDIVKSCQQCTTVRARPPQNSTIEWPKPYKKWSRIHIDHFLFEDKIFLVVIDALTKNIECEIVLNTSAVETVAFNLKPVAFNFQ